MTDKNAKTKLETQKESLAKLIAKAEEKKKLIAELEAKKKSAENARARIQDKRIKMHTGGMVSMVGLHRYDYQDASISDNPQDNLIANLLVGILLRAAQSLEKKSTEELKAIWDEGKQFRKQDKDERVLPEVNPNIKSLIDLVRPELVIKKEASKLNRQHNDNDSKAKTEKTTETTT